MYNARQRHLVQSSFAAVTFDSAVPHLPATGTPKTGVTGRYFFEKYNMSFKSLGLAEALVRAVAELGYHTPTPIQTQAIPVVLAGGDVLGGAQTGTGKTAGFVLPLLHRLHTLPRRVASRGKAAGWPPRALILTPTRELTAQVEASVRAYGQHLPLKSFAVFGGVGIGPQLSALRRGVDVLVATPGRLLDLQQQGAADLRGIEILVLDEADRMLDMGFIPDIRRILKLLPAERQNLLFSATFSDEIKALADGLLKNPTLIEVGQRNGAAEVVAQKVHLVERTQKRTLLAQLIKTQQWFQVLVFTRTKHGANKLAEQLEKDDIPALAIHGNKSQAARTRALSEFKSGKLQVLVATDIAARGIDIDQLPHVVNYDLPNVPEDYVHRIGRTGRAGKSGEAVSLVSADELGFLADIEKLIKRQLPREAIAGFELKAGSVPQAQPAARRGKPAARPKTPRQGREGQRRPDGPFATAKTAAKSPQGDARKARPQAPAPKGQGRSQHQGGATAPAPRGFTGGFSRGGKRPSPALLGGQGRG
ncbi:ATP-dependent RNA helicase DDX31/DBP7 [Burkholderiales bacterium]|nr:ATP-dependent RNA helicase DDX31/DBP7 [Burkholderiales bacterium]